MLLDAIAVHFRLIIGRACVAMAGNRGVWPVSSKGAYLILPNRGMTPVAQVGFT